MVVVVAGSSGAIVQSAAAQLDQRSIPDEVVGACRPASVVGRGLRKMAEATTTHGFWELMRIARWHVEGDAFDRALAVVVEAQAARYR